MRDCRPEMRDKGNTVLLACARAHEIDRNGGPGTEEESQEYTNCRLAYLGLVSKLREIQKNDMSQAGKRYFWDMDDSEPEYTGNEKKFGLEDPDVIEGNPLSIEQGARTLSGGYMLTEMSQGFTEEASRGFRYLDCLGGLLSNSEDFFCKYIVLYVDKELCRRYPGEVAFRRDIYCLKEGEKAKRVVETVSMEYKGPTEAQYWEGRKRDLERQEEARLDRIERLIGGITGVGMYTSFEQALMGRFTPSEYFELQMGRDAMRRDISGELEKEKAMMSAPPQVLSTVARQEKKKTVEYLYAPFASALVYDGTLAALYLREDQVVTLGLFDQSVTKDNFAGPCYEKKELGKLRMSRALALELLAKKYWKFMKAPDPLSPPIRGLTEQEFRYWLELRYLYSFHAARQKS